MLRAVFAVILFSPSLALAVGNETDGISVGLEFGGHFGTGPGNLSRTQEDVSFGELGPPIDEIAVTFGATVDELASELALRLGYGFAQGSADSDAGDVDYAIRRIPVTLAWRAALLSGPVHPLIGADLGGLWTSGRYEGAFNGESGTGFGFSARFLAGVDLDAGPRTRLRAFAQYRLDPDRAIPGGPDLSGSHVGFGLGAVFRFDRPEPDEGPGGRLALNDASDDRNAEDAYALIRRADELARAGRAVEAERAYAQGVRRLPRDRQTRENVEVPVRVDWARQLVKVGRRSDALSVLEAAIAITPEGPALDAYRALGGKIERRERAPVRERSDDDRMPVVPRDR